MSEGSHERPSGPPSNPGSDSAELNSVVSKVNLSPQKEMLQLHSSPQFSRKSKGNYFSFSEFNIWRGPYMKNQTDQRDISTR
jgi:hypothetical protein